jgi:hypothetical protein
MEIQNWIIVQMVLDLFIACVLLWLLRLNMKSKGADNEQDEMFRKSQGILAEMRALSLSADRNLEEQERRSRMILEDIDEAIRRAEDICIRLNDSTKDLGANTERSKNVPKNSDQVRTSVKALIAKGLSREEIAQHLGMSVDEIDLLIKLHSHSGQEKKKNEYR